MYIAPGRGRQSLGDKSLMSTETSCDFGHLLYLTYQQFSCIFSNTKGSKLDLGVKKVKVNLRLSFEQTLLGPSPGCCIPRPKVIVPLVPEKKIFKAFLPYMSVAAILVV